MPASLGASYRLSLQFPIRRAIPFPSRFPFPSGFPWRGDDVHGRHVDVLPKNFLHVMESSKSSSSIQVSSIMCKDLLNGLCLTLWGSRAQAAKSEDLS